MDISELSAYINKRPGTALSLTGAIVVIVILLGLVGARHRQPKLPVIPENASYTTDDGATLFTDSLSRIPPFDHDGHPAVRAYVFRGASRRPWVQYLWKYSDAGKERLGTANSTDPGASAPSASDIMVKRPGERAWVRLADPSAASIMEPKDPDGGDPSAIVIVNP